MSRIAILSLSTDDFGIQSNLYFINHGPSIPKSLLQRGALGFTRAKVAVSIMENMNDCIKNIRYNQHLTHKKSIGYINIRAKKVRTMEIDFESTHEGILKWAASCVIPFTGVVWVDANWEAVSRTARRNVPSRPLLLQKIQPPFFKPLTNDDDQNDRRASISSGAPPIVLTARNPSGSQSGGGGQSGGNRTNSAGQENWGAGGAGTSERALRRARKPAPGGIYSNNRNPAPYKLPDFKDGRASRIGSRSKAGDFITIAEKKSCGPGPQFLYSSFGNSNNSRPSSSMGCVRRGNSSSSAPAPRPSSSMQRTARRPSTVGSTAARVRFGKSARFHHPKSYSGVSEKQIVVNDTVCMVRCQTPGPRYFLGDLMGTMGGRNSRVSQCMAKQHGQPSANFSRSPRW